MARTSGSLQAEGVLLLRTSGNLDRDKSQKEMEAGFEIHPSSLDESFRGDDLACTPRSKLGDWTRMDLLLKVISCVLQTLSR